MADKRMDSRTRSKSKTASQMAAVDNSNKLDRVLANVEILLKANDQKELQLRNILLKLEALEKTAEEINDLKESYNHLEGKINEVESKVDEKVSRADVAALERNTENLEDVRDHVRA